MPATKTRTISGRTRTRRSRRGITPEDLSRLVFVGSPQISPDGRRIVFVHKQVGEKNEYVTNLWMVECAGDRDLLSTLLFSNYLTARGVLAILAVGAATGLVGAVVSLRRNTGDEDLAA